MNYFEIVKNAFNNTVKHKYLWLLGILSGFTVLQVNNKDKNDDASVQQVTTFIQNNPLLTMFIVILILIAIAVLIYIQVSATGGLITAIDKIEKGEKDSFKAAFLRGAQKFWGMFSSGLIIFILGFIPLLAMILVLLSLIFSGNWAGVLIFAVFLLPLFVWVILLMFISPYVYIRYMLTSDRVWQNFRTAFRLIKTNFVEIFMGYLSALVAILAFLVLVFICVGIGGFLYGISIFVLSGLFQIIFLVIALTPLLIIFFTLVGIINSIIWSIYHQIYQKITQAA